MLFGLPRLPDAELALRLPSSENRPGSDAFVTVLKEASRLYAASWVRDIGPDLRPNDYKKDDETEGKPNGDKSRTKVTEPSTLEDIVVAARGGMETFRPALQRLYMTRASAYRDALKSFIVGYQEGIQQVMDKKEDSSKPQEEDVKRVEDEIDLVPKAKDMIRGKGKWDREIFSCSYYIYTVLSQCMIGLFLLDKTIIQQETFQSLDYPPP
ncbi:hypothetical protein GQ457_12G011930 [Hibiscus cannabinus]